MNHSEEETTKSIAIIAIIAVVVVVVFSSYNIVSAYAVIAHQQRFCFTTTDTVVLGACAQSFGQCKKTQDLFVSEGYTIAEPCHKV
jgi:hypothetical protein